MKEIFVGKKVKLDWWEGMRVECKNCDSIGELESSSYVFPNSNGDEYCCICFNCKQRIVIHKPTN